MYFTFWYYIKSTLQQMCHTMPNIFFFSFRFLFFFFFSLLFLFLSLGNFKKANAIYNPHPRHVSACEWTVGIWRTGHAAAISIQMPYSNWTDSLAWMQRDARRNSQFVYIYLNLVVVVLRQLILLLKVKRREFLIRFFWIIIIILFSFFHLIIIVYSK